MSNLMRAAQVYRAASAVRSPRELEADVFRRASGALRAARDGSATARVRAIIDNRRLWSMVRALARDPANQLHPALCGELISVAMAAERELAARDPNFEILIALNENIAEGLVALVPSSNRQGARP